jgi:tRNA-dihydrouridine synthase B
MSWLKPLHIGTHIIDVPLALAPMAGVTDRPFRQLCRELGAGHVVSEMVASESRLWTTSKSKFRMDHSGEPGPITVQIVGYDPDMLAAAARQNVERGAQIIDINMGCPAKKVCNKWAGSALMQDEALALSIIEAVVAVAAQRGVPVTLKMRTGWCQAQKNAVVLARAAEQAGVQMITVHGRTREQGYKGVAEYDTIAAVKAAVRVPVVANGDIDSPEKALEVLAATQADAVMIGRAAQGRPWIFREMAHFMATGQHLAPPLVGEVKHLLIEHLYDHYALYGEYSGVRTARKHIGWYVKTLPGGEAFRAKMNLIEDCALQAQAVADFFDELNTHTDRMPAAVAHGLPMKKELLSETSA